MAPQLRIMPSIAVRMYEVVSSKRTSLQLRNRKFTITWRRGKGMSVVENEQGESNAQQADDYLFMAFAHSQFEQLKPE